jgi:hypothetical protein
MLGEDAPSLVAIGADPVAGKLLFEQMSRDIGGGGGDVPGCPLTHACYAMGYNLAVRLRPVCRRLCGLNGLVSKGCPLTCLCFLLGYSLAVHFMWCLMYQHHFEHAQHRLCTGLQPRGVARHHSALALNALA